MEEWKEYRLIDVLDALIDYRGKTPKKTAFGVPLITAKIIKNGRIETPSEFISLNDYDSWMVRGFPKVGDVVLTTEAPLGEVAQLDDANIALAQRVVTLRGKSGVLDNTYLKYYFLSNVGHQRLKARETGTTVTGIKQSELREVIVDVPPYEIQVRISNILKSLDDKIENNRRINENLEQQAQALFKSWFVDFEPFKDQPFVESELGMIPEGWRVEPLANIMNFQEGPGIRNWQYVQNSGTKFINIRCIKDGDIYTETANMISNQEANGKYAHFMLQSGDIVMSCSGTLGRYAIVREDHLPLCLNTSVIRFIPISNFDYSFVLGTLTSSYFLNKQIEMACGSVQANFGPTHLKQMKILVPPEAIRTQYNEKCYPIIHLIQKQKYESRRLAELRDTLLPRLMSGELKVDEINL